MMHKCQNDSWKIPLQMLHGYTNIEQKVLSHFFVTQLNRFTQVQYDQIWRNSTSLAKEIKVLNNILRVSIQQTFVPNLTRFYAIMAIFRSCKWPNVKKISSHLVTLPRYISLEQCIHILIGFEETNLRRKNYQQEATSGANVRTTGNNEEQLQDNE